MRRILSMPAGYWGRNRDFSGNFLVKKEVL